MVKPKSKSGQLLWRRGGYSGRYRTLVDGEWIRVCVALGTDNASVARIKLDKLIAGDAQPGTVQAPETFEEAARRIVATATIRTKSERLSRLERYAFGQMGPLPVTKITPMLIKAVLASAKAEIGRHTTTIAHLLHDIRSVMAELRDDRVIPEDPAKDVKLKAVKSTHAPRIKLSDAEFERFVSCGKVDLELRMLGLTSRCLGGMRSSDLHDWDWRHVDTTSWESAFVPRRKTGKVEAGSARHALPPILVEPLKAWWQKSKRPLEGPVFPVRKGPTAGGQKRKTSYAKALRRALWDAGIVRPLPGYDEADPKPEHCQIQTGGKHNSRLDFHSFRRSFATAAAHAGLNVQSAMALCGHADAKTHMLYVESVTVLAAPDKMMPRINAQALSVPTLSTPSGLTTENHSAPERIRTFDIRLRRSAAGSQQDVTPEFYDTVRTGASLSPWTVPTARAQRALACDAALKGYLRSFADSFSVAAAGGAS